MGNSNRAAIFMKFSYQRDTLSHVCYRCHNRPGWVRTPLQVASQSPFPSSLDSHKQGGIQQCAQGLGRSLVESQLNSRNSNPSPRGSRVWRCSSACFFPTLGFSPQSRAADTEPAALDTSLLTSKTRGRACLHKCSRRARAHVTHTHTHTITYTPGPLRLMVHNTHSDIPHIIHTHHTHSEIPYIIHTHTHTTCNTQTYNLHTLHTHIYLR